jgi:chromosomal replication initiation ATPase DnaA
MSTVSARFGNHRGVSPSQLSLGLQASPAVTREAFVVSASNAAAAEALDAFPDAVGGVLGLVGPHGSGKTHLLTAWADRTGAALLSGELAAVADLHALRGRLVALDDADHADDETLFHLFNMAGEAGAGLVLAARLAPAAWETDLPDLRSRLNAVRLAQLAEPDDAVLRGVLVRFFAEASVRPSHDLLEYLVRRIGRSVPDAREVVRRLIEAAAPQHRPVTRALAREVLDAENPSGELPF